MRATADIEFVRESMNKRARAIEVQIFSRIPSRHILFDETITTKRDVPIVVRFDRCFTQYLSKSTSMILSCINIIPLAFLLYFIVSPYML